MREGFSVSATIEALHFLIPCTLCDELVVKGDDCPSWGVSLVVKFIIWLNKTRRVPILKLVIPKRNNRKHRKKHQNHDRKTAHGTTADFVLLLPVENPPFVLLFFTTQISLNKSRPYKNSASYEYWRWTRTHGITTYLRFSTTTGRERTVLGRAAPYTPLLELRTRT